MKTAVTISLDTERDRDILAWINRHPERGRSEAIRVAIRAHIQGSSVTLADVLREVQSLRRGGIITGTVHQPPPEAVEPADAAAALDGLGL